MLLYICIQYIQITVTLNTLYKYIIYHIHTKGHKIIIYASWADESHRVCFIFDKVARVLLYGKYSTVMQIIIGVKSQMVKTH